MMTQKPILAPWCQTPQEEAVWRAEQELKVAKREAHHARETSKPSSDPTAPVAVTTAGKPLWTFLSVHTLSDRGNTRKFATPEELVEACIRYFQWADANAIEEQQLFSSAKFGVIKATKAHKRPYTHEGLLLFIGIHFNTWYNWSNPFHKMYRPDLAPVIEHVRNIIYEQKFTGAAVGLFNANLVARSLNLVERHDVTTNGEEVAPVTFNIKAIPTGQFFTMDPVSSRPMTDVTPDERDKTR